MLKVYSASQNYLCARTPTLELDRPAFTARTSKLPLTVQLSVHMRLLEDSRAARTVVNGHQPTCHYTLQLSCELPNRFIRNVTSPRDRMCRSAGDTHVRRNLDPFMTKYKLVMAGVVMAYIVRASSCSSEILGSFMSPVRLAC